MTAPEGPARIVDRGSGGFLVSFPDRKICSFETRCMAEDCRDNINSALSPLLRKAEMCGRMAYCIRDLLSDGAVMTDRTTGESLPPYKADPDYAKELLAEYDREGGQ
jgi:hypothetical protein